MYLGKPILRLGVQNLELSNNFLFLSYLLNSRSALSREQRTENGKRKRKDGGKYKALRTVIRHTHYSHTSTTGTTHRHQPGIADGSWE